eukprot:UC4_evm2s714
MGANGLRLPFLFHIPTLLFFIASHPSRARCSSTVDSAQAFQVADFTPFELDVLPRWLKAFRISHEEEYDDGKYRATVGGPQAVYGTADIIHLLSTIGLLANFSSTKRDDWAAVLASFQNETITCGSSTDCPGFSLGSKWPGFYALGDGGKVGHSEPWHSCGDVTSSFHLLGRLPAVRNPMFDEIARNLSLWLPTFKPIVYTGIQ